MFDHVTIRVSDRSASERCYRTLLAVLGAEPTYDEADLLEWDDFSIAPAGPRHPVSRGLHVGFSAPSREAVDAFHRVGVEAGYRSDGEPGPRPQYVADYYGAFLLDPDGNSIEAVHHEGVRRDGTVDHVWLRVADVAAARRFYALVGEYAGFGVGTDTAERVSFKGGPGTFSVVPGRPTRNVHLAFPAAEERVREFHRACLQAGYRDNGAPGERPEYHPGYYGAFVLDPDGNNVELVDHHRD